MLKHPTDPDTRKTIIIVAIVALLFGSLMFFLNIQQSSEAPQQLTAEQVVDLEVQAEKKFLEAGGEF